MARQVRAAVTGHGLQACDQKQKGKFDIEAARLWDDGLVEAMHAKEWLNAADFDKGLEIARTRYPEQPRNGAEPTKEPPEAAPLLPAARLEERWLRRRRDSAARRQSRCWS